MALKTSAIPLALALTFTLGGLHCKKNETPRCGRCGMVVDPKSAFQAELLMPDTGGRLAFDSPKCALKHRATRKVRTTLRVQEYYSRNWIDGSEVRFVIGSDVIGPMGKDFIGVSPSQTEKFVKDHGGDKTLTLAEIDDTVLASVP